MAEIFHKIQSCSTSIRFSKEALPIKHLRKIDHPLKGEISVPGDKSITHRALLLSGLARGKSIIYHPLLSEDCLATVRVLEALGVRIEKKKNEWIVIGPDHLMAPSRELDCGNSGTTMRLTAGILAGQTFHSTLTGDSSLSRRPMARVAEPLKKMGARVSLSEDRYPPIRMEGHSPLTAVSHESVVASAQVKSCILLAGLFAEGETSIIEPEKSRDHTERMFKAAGLPMRVEHNRVSIQGPARPSALDWEIPGDFSSAAFFLAAGLIVPGSTVVIKNVNTNPTRTGLLRVLERMGARIEMKNQRWVGGEPLADLHVESGRLKGTIIQSTEIPSLIDEVPILTVLATQSEGRTEILGAGELRVKESDRLSSLVKGLSRMGAHIQEKPDGLIVEGPTRLRGQQVDTQSDHRMAMAFAVASLMAEGETLLEGGESVAISYPNFWEVFEGFKRATSVRK